MEELVKRRADTQVRTEALKLDLKKAEKLLGNVACVYATGSFGRQEASRYSDLDLFIVGRKNGLLGSDGAEGSLLRRLEEIRIKAELIDVTQRHAIPEFDGDAKYLAHYSVDKLTKFLGKPEDDHSNTFTARLLLLLESSPILGDQTYSDIIDDVIAAYWGDYEKHKNNFVPAFLVNDILRLWRTFCVNYEARTERVPEDKRIKRKVKNYKLKFSRMLTCFSAILAILSDFARYSTVSTEDVSEMVSSTPTARLERLIQRYDEEKIKNNISELLRIYDRFLVSTDIPEDILIDKFSEQNYSKKVFEEANLFGDVMFDALRLVGQNSRLHRMLIV